jgi:hypothetical protein
VAVLQPLQEVLGVDHGDDGIEPGSVAHVIVDEEGLGHRRGVGETGSLDQNGVEAALALHQALDDADEIAAHGAADAAVVHLEDFFLGIDHELVVDAEFAEFVDDDGVLLAMLLAQHAIEERRLAGAEIAGQHRNGDLVHDLSPSTWTL